MADLVREAELIAHVLVQGQAVRLSKDEKTVLTDYSAQVLGLLHQKKLGVQLGGVIAMTKGGGTLLLEGRTVSAYEPDFPPLEVGTEYVVFLKRDAGGRFVFTHGAQSAFAIVSDAVDQLSRHHAAWKQQRGNQPVDRSSFLQEIQRSLLELKHR